MLGQLKLQFLDIHFPNVLHHLHRVQLDLGLYGLDQFLAIVLRSSHEFLLRQDGYFRVFAREYLEQHESEVFVEGVLELELLVFISSRDE